MRRTKMVATLGPATSSDESIGQLVAAGVDVFRLNFSHGTRESHGDAVARIRRAAESSGRIVAVLQDLAGPKIRTGLLRGGAPLNLRPGDPLEIVIGDLVGEPGRVSTTYAGLLQGLQPGNALLLDDGRIQLKVDTIGA